MVNIHKRYICCNMTQLKNMIRTNLYVLILFSFHSLPFTEVVPLMVRLCASHLHPSPSRGREKRGFYFFNFQSLAKSPSLRGQICGKIPAKFPRPLGLTIVTNNK